MHVKVKIFGIETTAFLDSGATEENYMSQQLYEDHESVFKAHSREVTEFVILGDLSTRVPVSRRVEAEVDMGEGTKVMLSFGVFNTGHSLVLGLPTLLGCLFNFYVRLLCKHRITPPDKDNPMSYIQSSLHADYLCSLIPAFSNTIDEAPEDLATELPVQCQYALSYMEKSHEEAVTEYRNLFSSQVSEEFRVHTKVLELLLAKGQQVFVPSNWTGIKGIEIDLLLKGDLPKLRPKARPINPKLFEAAEKEIRRLRQYHLVECLSDTACPIVIAPKSTPPYIRFCGDYTRINPYIVSGYWPIPNVLNELQRLMGFKYFLDIDLTNAFHQFKLSEQSSYLLSVVTPFGQFRPIFMPEGIGPASGILQRHVADIFSDFRDWSIVCFDNILLMAHDLDDAYRKLDIFLDRCIERNIFLKFPKTFLGFTSVKFFGYLCQYQKYSMTADRIKDVQDIPFPKSLREIQSFLGTVNFFAPFIPNYVDVVAQLYDMTRKDFSWNPSSWTVDYEACFERAKLAITQSSSLHYPDYNLQWILRTDASTFGVGGCLLQVAPDGSVQPIKYVSQKFSPQARNWTTIEQECFAIYICVKLCEYLLRCKPCILQCDHANLQYMETSIVPKIIRWRTYLQSFVLFIVHIPGKANTVADWLSRIHQTQESTLSFLLTSLRRSQKQSDKASDALVHDPAASVDYTDRHALLKLVHNARMGHHGVRRTYDLLCRHFPGHGIPMREVQLYIEACPTCQKVRIHLKPTIPPSIHTHKVDNQNSCVGCDTLTLATDDYGYTYLYVISNFFTKFVYLYPAKDKSAKSAALAVFKYFCLYGLVDTIRTDPGSDFTSESFKTLCSWLGVLHSLTLVNRPEANNVEGSNKKVLRHLHALIATERIQRQWSSDHVLPIIQHIINVTPSEETGAVPLLLTFGTAAFHYHRLPLPNKTPGNTELLQILDDSLQSLRKTSKDYQQRLHLQRVSTTPAAARNSYQLGDFVLYLRSTRANKLAPLYKGPYKVMQHTGNTVLAANIITGEQRAYHVGDLSAFIGSAEEARTAALLDQEQYEVEAIVGHRGDPGHRSSMTFSVLYKDGDLLWQGYSPDLALTVQFEQYCRRVPGLISLVSTISQLQQLKQQLLKAPIVYNNNDTAYISLQCFGYAWYSSKDLPDADTTTYCMQVTFARKRAHTIEVHIPVLRHRMTVDAWYIYCNIVNLLPPAAVLVTEELAIKYDLLG